MQARVASPVHRLGANAGAEEGPQGLKTPRWSAGRRAGGKHRHARSAYEREM